VILVTIEILGQKTPVIPGTLETAAPILKHNIRAGKSHTGREKPYWEGKVILREKSRTGREKLYWEGKVILERKSYWDEKVILGVKSHTGSEKSYWEGKSY
jgi:hypothetical protein